MQRIRKQATRVADELDFHPGVAAGRSGPVGGFPLQNLEAIISAWVDFVRANWPADDVPEHAALRGLVRYSTALSLHRADQGSRIQKHPHEAPLPRVSRESNEARRSATLLRGSVG